MLLLDFLLLDHVARGLDGRGSDGGRLGGLRRSEMVLRWGGMGGGEDVLVVLLVLMRVGIGGQGRRGERGSRGDWEGRVVGEWVDRRVERVVAHSEEEDGRKDA